MAEGRYQPLPQAEQEPHVVVQNFPAPGQVSQYAQDEALAKQLDAQLNGAVAPIAVVVGQPGFPQPMPVQAPRVFEGGMYDCCNDCGTCCMGFWPCGCQQALFAENMENTGLGDYSTEFFKMCGLTFMLPTLTQATGLGALSCAVNVMTAIYASQKRGQMRAKYGLTGTHCCCSCIACCCGGDQVRADDFCAAYWCLPCVICQDARTLRANFVRDGVWHGPPPAVTVAPAPYQGMQA